MKKHPLVIKLGGVLLESDQAIKRLFNVLRNYLKLYDRPIMIVHGGGRLIDQLMEKLKFPIVKKNGFRITPREHINVITGVLAGTANKILCSWTKKIGISAVGLCLSDGDSLKIKQLDKKLGHVGIAKSGSDKFLKVLFKNKLLPIISSIGITDEGFLMNVNADIAAAALAITLDADLILLSDVSAILDAKGQRIATMTENTAKKLIKQGIITDGMIVKVKAALKASRSLGRAIDIGSWHNSEQLTLLLNGVSVGTKIMAW